MYGYFLHNHVIIYISMQGGSYIGLLSNPAITQRGTMYSLLYFDYVAIPLYIVLLFSSYARGMTKGRSSRLFNFILILSIAATVCDIGMESLTRVTPVPDGKLIGATLFGYGYFLFHNATGLVYFLFIYSITNTWYLLRKKIANVIVVFPFAVFIAALITNPMTDSCFTVTAENGYSRGPMMVIFYASASIYVIVGLAHLIYCKRFLSITKWIALFSMYIFTYSAVIFQLFNPRFLIELVSSAISLLLIELVVQRPDEVMDSVVGLQGWNAYKETLRKIMITRQSVQILVIKFLNGREVRSYLGEDRYVKYIRLVASKALALSVSEHLHTELFFEHPGYIYLIIDEHDFDSEKAVPLLTAAVEKYTMELKGTGAKLEPKVCSIKFPDVLDNQREIIHLGHHFTELMPHEQLFIEASEINKTKEFQIINNMNDILTRAIQNESFEVYYQPIYSIWDHKFISAEALLRLNDEKYGPISPATFIPEAERRGVILPIGDFVLNAVHKFASENELEQLGLSYIEINLSVAQCLEKDLPDKLRALRTKYKVGPEKVNLEITETADNIGNIMDVNLKALSEQGYTFSLDDYGVGYSNIQRVSKLPLKIVKIDKSLVDNMNTVSGKSIMNNTVRMMKDIKKELVVEGVETKEDFEALRNMGCDFIQGFYFSKPLPAKEFLHFLKENNLKNA